MHGINPASKKPVKRRHAYKPCQFCTNPVLRQTHPLQYRMSMTLLGIRDLRPGHNNVPRKATKCQEVFRSNYLQEDCDWPFERDIGSVEKSDGSAILISNEANISADSGGLGISDVTPRV